MKKINVQQSLTILEKIWKAKQYLNNCLIKRDNFSYCFGKVPKEYQEGKETHYEYATIRYELELPDSYIFSIKLMQETLIEIEDLTGWECHGLNKKKDKITLYFVNYNYKK